MTQPDSLLAQIRALLNTPYPYANAVIKLIRDWPDEDERKVAAEYAYMHFEAIREHGDIARYSAPSETRMHFNKRTKTLSMADGTLIKELCCPLEKTWDELEEIDKHDMARRCRSCSKNVLNTRGLDAHQVHAIVQYDPKVCIHVDASYGNVEWIRDFETPPKPHQKTSHTEAPQTLRTIRTARTVTEINFAAMHGLWPLVKRVEVSGGKLRKVMLVHQNQHTGEVRLEVDSRYSSIRGNFGEWNTAIPNISFDPSCHFPSPIAAYLIPDDITVGEKVYLEDVIENFIGHRHNGTSRLRSVEAIWTGEDFEIEYNDFVAPSYVG